MKHLIYSIETIVVVSLSFLIFASCTHKKVIKYNEITPPIIDSVPIFKTSSPNYVYKAVQKMPKFKYGDIGLYLDRNIRYPYKEKKEKITGTVYVGFIIEKDGSVSGIKILKGVTGGPGLDKEALRVVSGMPKWQSGMQNGIPARVQYTIPIHFELR